MIEYGWFYKKGETTADTRGHASCLLSCDGLYHIGILASHVPEKQEPK
jgi:hypothetical protein